MRNGDISPQQADAITDAARLNPDAEADLLDSAKTDDLGTLKTKARRAKSSADPNLEARNRRIHARRSLKHWTNDEGEFHAHLCTTPEAGARFLAGLDPHRKAVFDAARKAGRREAPEAYAADALDALARGATPTTPPSAAATPPPSSGPGSPPDVEQSPHRPDRPNHGAARRSGRDEPTEPSDATNDRADRADRAERADNVDDVIDLTDGAPGSDPPERSAPSSGSPPGTDPPPTGSPASCKACGSQRPKAPKPPAAVKLNIDFAPLIRGHLEPGDVCEIPGVGPIPLPAARALLGNSIVDLIIKKGDDIRSVVHLGRSVTADQRRAIGARDPCCIRPGCGRTQNLEIDHRDGWAITKETSLDDSAASAPMNTT